MVVSKLLHISTFLANLELFFPYLFAPQFHFSHSVNSVFILSLDHQNPRHLLSLSVSYCCITNKQNLSDIQQKTFISHVCGSGSLGQA